MKQTMIINYFRSLVLSIFFLSLGFSSTAQLSFIEEKSANYILKPGEVEMRNKVLLPGMAEATWIVKANPIQNFVNEGNLQLTLPGMVNSMTFEVDGVYSATPDDYYLAAYNVDGGFIQVSKSANDLMGTIYNSSEGRYYGLQSLSAETAVLLKYNEGFIPSGDVCPVFSDAEDEHQEASTTHVEASSCDNQNNTIRVLFLFSPAAAGKLPSMSAFAGMIIGQLNTSTYSSGLSPSEVVFEMANALPLPGFTENGCSTITLNDLKSNEIAKSLRNDNWADIVCLIVDDVNLGIPPCDATGNAVNDANAGNAFCFSEITGARFKFKATHGIGHIIGLKHQRCTNCFNIRCSWSNDYPHGYKISDAFRTIMADCDDPVRVSRWSADNVPFLGMETGNQKNNNARKLRERAATVACFNPSNPPAMPTSVFVAGPPSLCVGGTQTYSMAGQGNPFLAVWEMRTNNSLWTPLGVGPSITVAGTVPGTTIYLRLTVPGVGSATKAISVAYCINNGESDDREDNWEYDTDINDLAVYPNPVTQELFITKTTESDKIIVSDMHGKVLVSTLGKPEMSIDMAKFSNGIYFVTIMTKSNSQHFKIVKQ